MGNILSVLNQLIAKTARLVSRTPEEMQLLESRTVVVPKIILFTLGITVILTMFGFHFFNEMNQRQTIDKASLIKPDWWKVAYDLKDGLCDMKVAVQPVTCPANPANYELWQSPFSRADSGHLGKVFKLQHKIYWLGLKLPVEFINQQLAKNANQIVLGYISATYEIWVDGVPYRVGNSQGRRIPAILELPLTPRTQDYLVAIKILNDRGVKFPDILDRGQERLVSRVEAESKVRLEGFYNESQPMVLAVSNLMIAVLFFFFWCSAVRKQEYWYLGMYALAHVGVQVFLMDFVYKGISTELMSAAHFTSRVYEGGLGLLFSLAYARVRLRLIRNLTFLIVGMPLLIDLVVTDVFRFKALNSWAGMYFVPVAYILGLSICAIQAIYLKNSPNVRGQTTARYFRLKMFILAMAFICVVYGIEASNISATTFIFSHRVTHIILIFFICWIVLLEYRDQETIINKTYLTKYHRRPVLPASVLGWTLKKDIKKSLAISRQLKSTSYHEFVSEWYRIIATVAIKYGGEVLSEEGDSMLIHFDFEKNAVTLHQVLGAVREMHQAQQYLKAYFDLKEDLAFRAAIVKGDLVPLWKMNGHQKKAGFGGDVLFEVSRLLELERDFNFEDDMGAVICMASDFSGISGFDFVAANLKDKNENSHDVVAVKLNKIG